MNGKFNKYWNFEFHVVQFNERWICDHKWYNRQNHIRQDYNFVKYMFNLTRCNWILARHPKCSTKWCLKEAQKCKDGSFHSHQDYCIQHTKRRNI